ncbi:MAG: response regulator [Planctomycetes bacterium]|nr:response regulator [Planctomycetota bacterium]
MAIRLMLVDGDSNARAAFKSALQGSKFEVVKECVNGDDAVSAYGAVKPEMVCLCLGAPGHAKEAGGGGIQLLARFKQADPQSRVLVLHTVDTQYLVMSAISSGAVGRIRKPYKKEAVLEALMKAEGTRSGRDAVKRTGARLKKALMVYYKKADEGIFTRMRSVLTDDLSPSGFGMKSPEALPEKTILKCEIELPGVRRVKLRGQVMRSKKIAGMDLHDIGVAITETSDEDQKALSKYILDYGSTAEKK